MAMIIRTKNVIVNGSRTVTVTQLYGQMLTTMTSSGSQSDAQSPIYLLPPEILGNIFGLAVIACKDAYVCKWPPRNIGYRSYATFFNFSFVSQHWRSVALSTPYIWGTLLFISRKLVSVMLERSKMANLSIHSQLSYRLPAVPLIMEVMNDHISRITEIALDIRTSEFLTLMEDLKQRPPSLRPCELRLRLTVGHNQTFPSAILVTDRLKVLEAENLTFAWEPSQSFPCLTHLTLGTTSLKIPIPDIITSLRGMPALEFLHIRNSLASEEYASPIQPVQLARLQILEIISEKYDSSSIPIFLTLITLPAATDILIYCNNFMWHRPRLSAFALSLHTLFRNMHMQPLQSFWACRSVNNGLQLMSSAPDVETHHLFIKFDLILEVGHSPEETMRMIFPALLRDEILSWRLGFGLCSKILFELSDTLPRLCNVVLEGDSMPNFIAVMMIGKNSSFPFPNLRCLTLYRAKFSSRFHTGLEAHELRKCLAERSKFGIKLEKLKISCCYRIYDKDIQRLREVVDVEWDGIVAKR